MRFASKQDFLQTIDKEWTKLSDYLEKITDEEMLLLPLERSGSMARSGDDWSAKDVLAHLHEWHNMTLAWYESGLHGQPDIPAKGYTWKTAPALNHEIYKKYKDYDLEEIRRLFTKTHKKTREIVEILSEAELLTPGQYQWTGKLPLASYFAGSTLSHYRWAFTTIKKIIKNSK